MRKRLLTLLASLLLLLASAHVALAGVVSGDYNELDQSKFVVGIDGNPESLTKQTEQVIDLIASADWTGLDGIGYPGFYPPSRPDIVTQDERDAYWYRYWGLELDWSTTTPGVVDIVKSGDHGQHVRVTTRKEGTTNIVVRLVRVDDPTFVVPVEADTLSITVKRDVNELYGFTVEMSGVPNTMTIIGQTCTLTANAGWYYDWDWGVWNPGVPEPEDYYHVYHYPNNPGLDEYSFTPWYATAAEWYEYWGLELRWRSTDPSVAVIKNQHGEYNQYADLVSLKEGKTEIRVDLVSKTNPGVPLKRDTVTLDVTSKFSYTNIHPDVWESLGLYNANMARHGEQLGFAESDPADVAAQSFQSAFTGRFGLPASQVTEIANAASVAFGSNPSFTKDGYEQLKPSMRVAVSSQASSGGALLPVAYTYSLSWEEVSGLLGRDVTSLSEYGELFEKIGIAFEDENGAALPVIDGTSYAQAAAAGALRITSGGGLTLALDAMLADVNAGTADRAAWIGDSLVVPDGKANGTSGGSMWLVRKAGAGEPAPGNGGTAGSGGGGGCDAGAGGLLAAALGLAFGLRRR